MINKLGGRKFLVGTMLVVVGVAVDMIATGGLSSNLVDLLKFIGVGFYLGNGIEHIADAAKKKKPKIVNDTAKMEKILAEIQQAQIVISQQVEVAQKQGAYIIDTAFGPKQKAK